MLNILSSRCIIMGTCPLEFCKAKGNLPVRCICWTHGRHNHCFISLPEDMPDKSWGNDYATRLCSRGAVKVFPRDLFVGNVHMPFYLSCLCSKEFWNIICRPGFARRE